MTRSFTFVLLLVVFLFCLGPVAAQDAVVWPTTDWPTSTPEEQGMDSAALAEIFRNFSQPHFNMDSLLVVRNGHIVAEAYAPPFSAETRHYLYSASKSVISALFGILLRDGYLESLDTPVLEIFPDLTVQNLTPDKEAMTVRDVLLMAPGIECDDQATDNAVVNTMMNSEDWLQFTLDLPMMSEPGSEFHYCNPATYLLSAIITELTGKSALDFAAEELFEPLGITDYAWSASPQGVSYGFADLQLTTRDMAKFGYLYLNGGVWEGEQILPADFVEESLQTQIPTPWPNTGYSYQWWSLDDIETAMALGWAGQYIEVVPATDTVAVLTGSFTESVRVMLHGFPFFYAIAALPESPDAPLDANPEAVADLEATITAIENPVAEPVAETPALGLEVSDLNYTLFTPFVLRHFGAAANVDLTPVTNISLDFANPAGATLTMWLADGQEWTAPIGLNGLDQVSEGPYGAVGLQGEWLSDDIFAMEMKEIGAGTILRLEFHFMPGAVNIIGSEYSKGVAFTSQGVVMPE
jgi:CubicO group peptidase (beta-lactamase class C family)